MTRKMISALLALILCVTLALPVSAEAKAIDFVVDEIGYLGGAEVDLLNKQAAAIYEECGVGIFFVYTIADDLENYDIETLLVGIQDYVIMLENADSWFTFYGGKGEEIDLATEEKLRAVYDRADTYIEGVSEFLDAAADCFAPVVDRSEAERYFLYDEADLLTDGEEAVLTGKLQSISSTYQAQLVVCTIASMDGADIDRYLENESGDDTGLDITAISMVIDPELIGNKRECRVNEYDAFLCELGDRSYLCWTLSPELSCVIEYSAEAISEESIFRMAESVPVS